MPFKFAKKTMVIISTMYISDCNSSTSSSSDSSTKQTSKHAAGDLRETLTCYVCERYYTKPRILPCGHSYCSACLVKLRESAADEFNKSRDANAHRRGECGFFTCPWPNCHYTLRIMNVWRWTLKNRTLSQAVSAVKRRELERQSSVTQTEAPWTEVVKMFPEMLLDPLGLRDKTTSKPLSASARDVALHHVVNNAASCDVVLFRQCQFPDVENNGSAIWKNYALTFGLLALEHVFNISTF